MSLFKSLKFLERSAFVIGIAEKASELVLTIVSDESIGKHTKSVLKAVKPVGGAIENCIMAKVNEMKAVLNKENIKKELKEELLNDEEFIAQLKEKLV